MDNKVISTDYLKINYSEKILNNNFILFGWQVKTKGTYLFENNYYFFFCSDNGGSDLLTFVNRENFLNKGEINEINSRNFLSERLNNLNSGVIEREINSFNSLLFEEGEIVFVKGKIKEKNNLPTEIQEKFESYEYYLELTEMVSFFSSNLFEKNLKSIASYFSRDPVYIICYLFSGVFNLNYKETKTLLEGKRFSRDGNKFFCELINETIINLQNDNFIPKGRTYNLNDSDNEGENFYTKNTRIISSAYSSLFHSDKLEQHKFNLERIKNRFLINNSDVVFDGLLDDDNHLSRNNVLFKLINDITLEIKKLAGTTQTEERKAEIVSSVPSCFPIFECKNCRRKLEFDDEIKIGPIEYFVFETMYNNNSFRYWESKIDVVENNLIRCPKCNSEVEKTKCSKTAFVFREKNLEGEFEDKTKKFVDQEKLWKQCDFNRALKDRLSDSLKRKEKMRLSGENNHYAFAPINQTISNFRNNFNDFKCDECKQIILGFEINYNQELKDLGFAALNNNNYGFFLLFFKKYLQQVSSIKIGFFEKKLLPLIVSQSEMINDFNNFFNDFNKNKDIKLLFYQYIYINLEELFFINNGIEKIFIDYKMRFNENTILDDFYLFFDLYHLNNNEQNDQNLGIDFVESINSVEWGVKRLNFKGNVIKGSELINRITQLNFENSPFLVSLDHDCNKIITKIKALRLKNKNFFSDCVSLTNTQKEIEDLEKTKEENISAIDALNIENIELKSRVKDLESQIVNYDIIGFNNKQNENNNSDSNDHSRRLQEQIEGIVEEKEKIEERNKILEEELEKNRLTINISSLLEREKRKYFNYYVVKMLDSLSNLLSSEKFNFLNEFGIYHVLFFVLFFFFSLISLFVIFFRKKFFLNNDDNEGSVKAKKTTKKRTTKRVKIT